MEVNDYVIQYPIDAVHTVKFAELLGVLSITVESSPAVILRYRLPHLMNMPQPCLIWLMTVLSNGMSQRS